PRHEVPDQHVAREREQADDERPADRAPRRLDGERGDPDRENHRLGVGVDRHCSEGRELDRDVPAQRERERGEDRVVPRHGARRAAIAGFFYVPLPEPEAQKREREADAIGPGRELLVEQHQPERPEEVERPRYGTCDEQRGKRAFGGTQRFSYPFQMPASLKYLIAPGWCGRLGCALPASASSKRLKFGWPAASSFLFSRIALMNCT